MPACLGSYCSKSLAFSNALKGATLEYMHKCETFVSSFEFEEARPATRKAALETMCNDAEEIKSRLDNKLNVLSENFRNLNRILRQKEPETQNKRPNVCSYCRKRGHFPINANKVLLRIYTVHFAAVQDIWKICVTENRC